MKLRAYPIVNVTKKTRVTHQAWPWRARVVVMRDGYFVDEHIFDPPYQRVVTGRFGITPPISKRYSGALG